MGNIVIKPQFRLALWVILLLALPAGAADDERYLLGLGLHEETGRSIYLGGIYLASGAARPAQLEKMPDPWTMEYRIVARRTSVRSLLGSMLLQSEVATGRSPGPATTAFADNILTAVQSSLYAGDAFEIQLQDNVTYATLNGQRLARSSNPQVAAYILSGWISEQGTNSAFRKDLVASDIPPELLEQYNATHYSPVRAAEVAAWFGDQAPPATTGTAAASPAPPETPTPAPAGISQEQAIDTGISTTPDAPGNDTAPAPIPTYSSAAPATAETVIANAMTETTTSGSAAVLPTGTGSLATASSGTGTDAATEAGERDTTGANPEQPLADTALAALVRDAELTEPSEQAAGVSALGVQEYSQRLATFHSNMISKVYRKIRYPKRAVRRNLQGRLELDVSIGPNGQLLAVEVASPSGHKILDLAAIDAANEAFKSNMDDIDEVAVEEFGTPDGNLVVPIPVQFRLE